MAKHRSHSIELKRQVAQEFAAGESEIRPDSKRVAFTGSSQSPAELIGLLTARGA